VLEMLVPVVVVGDDVMSRRVGVGVSCKEVEGNRFCGMMDAVEIEIFLLVYCRGMSLGCGRMGSHGLDHRSRSYQKRAVRVSMFCEMMDVGGSKLFPLVHRRKRSLGSCRMGSRGLVHRNRSYQHFLVDRRRNHVLGGSPGLHCCMDRSRTLIVYNMSNWVLFAEM